MRFSDFDCYLNFIGSDSTLMTYNSKQFIYMTYFVQFEFKGHCKLKNSDYIYDHLGSLGPKKRILLLLLFIFNVSTELR